MNIADRLVIVHVLINFLVAASRTTKDEGDGLLRPGTRLPAITPNGVELGTITKTKPKPDAKVTSPTLFTEWVQANYPDDVTWELGSDTAAITEVVREHAPELLTAVPTTAFVQAMRKRALDHGVVTGPGGEAEVPGFSIVAGTSNIQVRPGACAFAEVAALIKGGLSLEDLAPKLLENGDDR